jgi:hypothetical protein
MGSSNMKTVIRAVALVGLGAFIFSACSAKAPGSDPRGRDVELAKAADPAVF